MWCKYMDMTRVVIAILSGMGMMVIVFCLTTNGVASVASGFTASLGSVLGMKFAEWLVNRD